MLGLSRLYSSDFMRAAVNGLPDTIRTGVSAFERAHGMLLFPYLAQHPGDAAVFDAAMTSASSSEIPAILAAYDFSGFHSIVDVGGGRGALLRAVLAAYPKMRGILFDRPEVVAGARSAIEADGIADRVEIAGGDFFQAVPGDADAYVLKSVIHDWGDAQGIEILNRCREAMPKAGRILVIDPLVPAGDQPSPNKLLDLLMLAVMGSGGGRERTEAEFRELFEAAGFRLARVIPTRSRMSILEGFANA